MITLHFVDAFRGDNVFTQDSKIIDIGAPDKTVTPDDGGDDDGDGDGDTEGDDGGSKGGCFVSTLPNQRF